MSQTTADKISGFAALPIGWIYGRGKPPSAVAVNIALQVEAMLRRAGYPETDAFPGGGGEIAVTGYLNGCLVNIEVRDEGRYKEAESDDAQQQDSGGPRRRMANAGCD